LSKAADDVRHLHVYIEKLIDSLVDGGNLGGPFLRDAILDAKSQSLSCKGVLRVRRCLGMSFRLARLPGCDRWKIGVAFDRLFAHMFAAVEQEYRKGDSD